MQRGVEVLKYCALSILYFITVSADTLNDLPIFRIEDEATCPKVGWNVDMCLRVTYSDGSDDFINVHESQETKYVLKGKLFKTNAKVVIILRDEFIESDTIAFKSTKAPSCTRFSVDLKSSGQTACANVELPDEFDDGVLGRWEADDFLDEVLGSWEADDFLRVSNDDLTSGLGLDPNGYMLNVAVFYDDNFANEFGNVENANRRVEAIMALTDQKLSEDSLTTAFWVNVIAVEHKSGENWRMPWGDVFYGNGSHSVIVMNSAHEANLYIFLTAGGGIERLGEAYVGSLCSESRKNRRNVNRYWEDDVRTSGIVTHEIAHSMGIRHDFFVNKIPRYHNGVKCEGYMDYTYWVTGWSGCSVSDLTKYVTRQRPFCLKTIQAAVELNWRNYFCSGSCRIGLGKAVIGPYEHYIETFATLRRPLSISFEFRATRGAVRCGVVSLFPINETRYSGYSFGLAWKGKQRFGFGVDEDILLYGEVNNVREWNIVKIDMTEVDMSVYVNDVFQGVLEDTKYQSGKLRMGFNCKQYWYRNVVLYAGIV